MKFSKRILTAVIVVIMACSFVFCALADTSAISEYMNFGTFTDGLFGTFTDGLFGSDSDAEFGSGSDAEFGSGSDAEEVFETGDVDGKDGVTASDARLALRASVYLENLTPAQIKAADVNHDGEVNAKDARTILRVSVGLETL